MVMTSDHGNIEKTTMYTMHPGPSTLMMLSRIAPRIGPNNDSTTNTKMSMASVVSALSADLRALVCFQA